MKYFLMKLKYLFGVVAGKLIHRFCRCNLHNGEQPILAQRSENYESFE